MSKRRKYPAVKPVPEENILPKTPTPQKENGLTQTEVGLRAKDAARLLAIAESTLWKWVKQGHLPKGTRLGSKVTVWRKSDLEKLLTTGF